MNPPPPGSTGTLSFFPAIESTKVMNKYVLRMKMKTPDAGVFGWFAWARWSSIVPRGSTRRSTRPRRASAPARSSSSPYQPNDHVVQTRWPSFWKKGLPYLDALTLKIIPDEQAAIAALQAGAIDGATISADNARSLVGNSNLTVLKGMTSAFYELQFTVKAGENKPWADRRVRQAVNLAINRADLMTKVSGRRPQLGTHPARLRPVAAAARTC